MKSMNNILILLLCLGAATSAAAQQRTRVPFPIPTVTGPVTVDGAVTESMWETALKLPLNYEVRPGENIPPPVRTDVLLAYDDSNLYVAFKCYDDQPSAIRARFTDRDAMWNDDFIGIVLDTFNDERRAYEFFANPFGVQGDMLMDDVAQDEDENWNAIWESAGRIVETGYEVEVRIPFNQLRFQTTGGPQTWGIDLMRFYPRSDRHQITLFPRDRSVNSYLTQAQKVNGFAGIQRGQNLELIPTITALKSDERAELPHGPMNNLRANGDLGLSVKWGVTPNVTMNATINPDFSTVEADAVQLDVNNQFALFYNETRPFFLEGSDFFRTARMNLVHTRQIADPNGALKISGKNGRHAFGLFSAHDAGSDIILPGINGSDEFEFARQTTATVARYRFDTGANSTIGAMVTDRRGGGYFNDVIALDARQRFTSADTFSATVAMSATKDIGDIAAETSLDRRSDTAIDLNYEHSVRNWYGYGYFGNLGKDFRTDLGFITQVDKRVGEVGGGRIWHGDSSKFYNRIMVTGNVDQTNDQAGALFEREAEGYVSYNGRRETYLQYGGGARRRVHDGVAYDQRFQHAQAEIRPSRTMQLGVRLNWGDWIDFGHSRAAEQRNVRTSLNLNAGRHLAMRFSHIYDVLDVAGGRLYTAHVPELRVVYQRDLRTLLRAIVQYTGMSRDLRLYTPEDEEDAQSRDLFAQLLFQYKVNAQTAVYFGFTSGVSGTDRFAMTPETRTLFAKLSYAWLK